MDVTLAYGRTGLTVDLPGDTDLVVATALPGVANPAAALLQAIRQPIGSPPLADLVKTGDRVVIVHSDITRPTPNHIIMPVLLSELEAAGVRRQDITLLNGLGTHRAQTEAEMRALLGDAVYEHYRCLQHDAWDDANLVSLGETSLGNQLRVNRLLVDSDVRIFTGFIEPHLFAGYSGGPKAVLPALCGQESVLTNHSRKMIAHPKAIWGICEGNPIWEEMREAALKTDPTFLLNVTLNERKEITDVFAGDLLAAHEAGREFVREQAMTAVDEPYDIVITTNSGFPLDQNLYQTVKGMSAAVRIVREGGHIIMVAACEDGIPDHGRYLELLEEGGSPQGVLDMLSEPGFGEQDQWQVQIQAQIQLKAEVHVYSDGLSDEQISRALFTPCRDVAATVRRLAQEIGSGGAPGQACRICAMPEGPQVIATIDQP
jgi:nickel-dependent lactate racemase